MNKNSIKMNKLAKCSSKNYTKFIYMTNHIEKIIHCIEAILVIGTKEFRYHSVLTEFEVRTVGYGPREKLVRYLLYCLTLVGGEGGHFHIYAKRQ